MFIITKNNVVIAKGQEMHTEPNGIFLDGVVYGEPGVKGFETDKDPALFKDMFVDGKIVPNPEAISEATAQGEHIEELNKRIAELEEQVKLLEVKKV